MTRRPATRTALVTIGLLTLSACVVDLSFDVKKSVAVQTAGAAAFSQNVLVNLSDYKEITDHKDNIKSLSLQSLDATVATVNSGNKATKVSGTLVLRKVLTDSSADLIVGNINDLPVAVGQKVTIKGTPALDAFLLQQIHDAGTFYVVVKDGTVDGAADAVVDLTLHVSIGYDAGIL